MANIWQKIGKLVRGEKGNAAILAALALTGMLAATSFVTDVGVMYLDRVRLAKGLDAAALAGAQNLPEDPDLAQSKALEYAAKNGVDPAEVAVNINMDKKKVYLHSKRNVPLIFGRIMNQDQTKVGALTEAVNGAVVSIIGAAPLTIEKHDFVFGQEYLLKSAPGEGGFTGPLGSGNFNLLALGKPGADNYEDNLRYGYPKELQVGDIVDTQTGNVSGSTSRAIAYRLGLQPGTYTPENVPRDYPGILYVPVYEVAAYNGSNQVSKIKVVGFAAFLVRKVEGQGNKNFIYGWFIRTLARGEINVLQPDYGLRAVKLTRG